MKHVSLANLAVNAPPSATPAPAAAVRVRGPRRTAARSNLGNKITSDEDNELGSRIQVAFRMDKDAYKDLKRMALDEDTTVNELMIRAINELRERKGLKRFSA